MSVTDPIIKVVTSLNPSAMITHNIIHYIGIMGWLYWCMVWLYCTITIQYFKLVFLEILNVTNWSVFQNQFTYVTVHGKTDLVRTWG